MKKILLFIAISLVSLSLTAQTQFLTFEPAGGGATYVATAQQTSIGWTAGGDIAYTALWPIQKGFSMGIKTGVNTYCSSSKISDKIDDRYTRIDYLGHEMAYTITGDVTHEMRDVRVGIPVMMAMEYKGFLCNLGIKNVFPAAQLGQQDIDNLNIVAYYDDYAVPVQNELITGLVPDAQLHRKTDERAAVYTLGVSAELGYMGLVKGCHHLGFLIYVDYYPLYATPKSVAGGNSTPLVDVAAITNPEYPVPSVTVRALGSTITGLQSLSFGVKFVYGINLVQAARHRHGLH